MKLRLDTLPLSTNNMYAGRRVLTSRARATKEALAWEIMAQNKGKMLSGDVDISVDIFWPDRRRRDIDNLKMLFDAMTGILFEDDSQIRRMLIERHYSSPDPHVDITIKAYA